MASKMIRSPTAQLLHRETKKQYETAREPKMNIEGDMPSEEKY